MLNPNENVSAWRRWLPHAISGCVLAIAFVAGMHREDVIGLLPFGLSERILERDVPEQLKAVFPGATSFSKKVLEPIPHYVAYTGFPESQSIAGYAFWTTELQPQERGYDGPIKMLVGLDLNGKLTGVLVTEQHEPYGYFSVGLPAFPRQFKAKDIRDPFKVGDDVVAISRASISVNSAARAIRNSARIAARALSLKTGNTK
jgi:transcriptional regulator of nitric oxide reductase